MSSTSRNHALAALLVLGLSIPATLAKDETPRIPAPLLPSAIPECRANATNRFEIKGMHCEACAAGIRGELRLVPGLVSAEVSFPGRFAIVAHDTNRVSSSQIIRAIAGAGYEALPVPQKKGSRQ